MKAMYQSELWWCGVRPFVIAIAISFSSTAHADTSDCQDAIDQYNSAASDVSSTLRLYSRCLSSSDGHDDCSSEFARLKSDQDDFESAVSNYESECS